MSLKKFRRAASSTGFRIVPTRDLRSDDVPNDSSNWVKNLEDESLMNDPDSLMAFSMSFDAYGFLGDTVYALSNLVDQFVRSDNYEILECFNTTGLRVLLFAQARKWAKQESGGVIADQLTREVFNRLRSRL